MKQLVFILTSSTFVFLLILWLIQSNDKVEVVNVTVNRFDKYLFELFEQNNIEDISCLDMKFGSFNEVFVTQIMQISNEYNVEQCDKVINKLYDFTQNNDMQEAFDSTALLYACYLLKKDGMLENTRAVHINHNLSNNSLSVSYTHLTMPTILLV